MLKFAEKHAKVYAIIWLLFISVLFFLPGSALPKEKVFDEIHFDKIVHFSFFALLLFFWRFYFPYAAKYNWWILLLALCYGFGVEVVQHYFIANRSFDLGDVAADMTGAIAGVWFWSSRYKKIDPCRNRGRNQN
jgi:VanZ family protein